jgi:hypothetical protein
VQHRLNTAYTVLSRELRELMLQQSDADFGRGWRAGHDVGRLAGWEERDAETQRELAHKNDQIQALLAMVESYRMRGVDEEAQGAMQDAPSLAALAVSYPRQPVH